MIKPEAIFSPRPVFFYWRAMMVRLSFHLLIRLVSSFIIAFGIINWYVQHQDIVSRIPNHANPNAFGIAASPPYASPQQSLGPFYKNYSKSNTANEPMMRACLLVRNDNNLLAEWVAYHYTVLPLRHLIVGCDENATEDPMDVLGRWNDTDLTFEVWYPERYLSNVSYSFHNPHARYIKRQNRFLSKCLQYFHHQQQQNLGWVALVDTDEYIQLNPLDEMRDQLLYPQQEQQPFRFGKKMLNASLPFLSPNETLSDRVIERKRLRRILGLKRESNLTATTRQQQRQQVGSVPPTVLDVLEAYSKRHGTLPCHSMPRLRYSAVTDNVTTWFADSICHPKLDSNISSIINTSQLSTIRFLYHVPLEDFQRNNHAKVLIDLRRVPLASSLTVRNPHKPLKEECAGSYVPELISFLHVNHYLNDFHVYSGRKGDVRRDRGLAEWSKSGAHARDGVRCDHMHGWLNDFVRKFGMHHAQHLLGQS